MSSVSYLPCVIERHGSLGFLDTESCAMAAQCITTVSVQFDDEQVCPLAEAPQVIVLARCQPVKVT